MQTADGVIERPGRDTTKVRLLRPACDRDAGCVLTLTPHHAKTLIDQGIAEAVKVPDAKKRAAPENKRLA